jgi:hypothetical protein
MTMDTITPHTTVPQPARMAATGSHPLCLGLEHGLWLVDGAAVDLFLARVDAGGRPSSALHGLWRAEPGSVLWGANELRLGEWSLLAIGAPGHHLHWLGSDVAQARAAGGPQPADWVNAVDGWFAALGVAARVSDGTLPVVHDPLEAAQPAEQGEPGEFLLDGRLAARSSGAAPGCNWPKAPSSCLCLSPRCRWRWSPATGCHARPARNWS